MQVGEQLSQENLAHGHPGAVEEQGVGKAAQHSGDHIAGKVGVAFGAEQKAQGVLHGAEGQDTHRAVVQSAQGPC